MMAKKKRHPQTQADAASTVDMPLAGAPSFIERQFPVARVSAESFKERSAKQSQTLTGLGKWWGRKPLVLVRATILGLLLPATDDPRRDREIFLKLMTMDEQGLRRRKQKKLEEAVICEFATDTERQQSFRTATGTWRTDAEIGWNLCSAAQRDEWFESRPDSENSGIRQGPRKKDTQQRQREIRQVARKAKKDLESEIFVRLPYSRKLKYCSRPEHLDGPDEQAWAEINAHLGTAAHSVPELVDQLGKRRFGHRPRVGDSFCGAGSVPFEAARIGCDAYGSDLSPVAALLTWAALNIVGGGEELAREVARAQREVFDAVDRQVTEWAIEHNGHGWRADAYLYCVETHCPECGWRVPLAPSWLIGENPATVAELIPDDMARRYEINVVEGVASDRVKQARDEGTVRDSRLRCSHCGQETPIDMIRKKKARECGDAASTDQYHDSGLRLWENTDLAARPGDVFQERLYCIRWELPDLEDALCLEQSPRHPFGSELRQRWNCDSSAVVDGLVDLLTEHDRGLVAAARQLRWADEAAGVLSAKMELDRLPKDADSTERLSAIRYLGAARKVIAESLGGIVEIWRRVPARTYRFVHDNDLQREHNVLTLLRERFDVWQEEGFIPTRRIESGYNTTQPIRERGWTHWHHLFTPRQLLLTGLIAEQIGVGDYDHTLRAACLVGLSRCADYNARLSRWHTRTIGDKSEQVFSNQALNTLWNFAGRSSASIDAAFFLNLQPNSIHQNCTILPRDARDIVGLCDLWITDPPYADAINYHELGEFFLAWYEKQLPKLFPDWYTDSKRALAVKADDPVEFKQSMVACYRRLVEYMPDDGMQVVMFTHQDAGVWADLTMILWAAGLRVTAAWCIATETDSALKEGNYVQGTVLLVCRKRTDAEPVFLDEVNHRVEAEVRRQLDDMTVLEDASEPNFADADYQLAAYAAALRVLTERPIDEIDPEREISRVRPKGETGPVEQLIRNAVKIACDHLVPKGLEREMWKTLAPMERFYLKGLEVETHGEHRSGVFQELARGFGAADYTALLADTKANQAQLKTASECGKRMLSGDGFGSSLVRQILFAVHQITRADEVAPGLNWLRTELPDYWNLREKIVHVLDFLAAFDQMAAMRHWRQDAQSARLLAGAVRNDHV
jgi:adenine-specific DNA methylase